MQVGSARTSGLTHAIAWSGTAVSAVDLHQFVPPQFTQSEARGIDALGNIVGAAYSDGGMRHPVMWIPIPEPLALVALPMMLLSLWRVPYRRRARVVVDRVLPTQ
jgi:hypothetical protein